MVNSGNTGLISLLVRYKLARKTIFCWNWKKIKCELLNVLNYKWYVIFRCHTFSLYSLWANLLYICILARNLASTPMLSAVVVSATTPCIPHSACSEFTRIAVASLHNWWLIQTMSATGVIARLGNRWQNCDWSGHPRLYAWCAGHFLLPWWHAVFRWGLW